MTVEGKVNLLPKILEDLGNCINENKDYTCCIEEAITILEYIVTLNSMIDTREQKIKSALEIINDRLKENNNHVNARMEMFYYEKLKAILSNKKGSENE